MNFLIFLLRKNFNDDFRFSWPAAVLLDFVFLAFPHCLVFNMHNFTEETQEQGRRAFGYSVIRLFGSSSLQRSDAMRCTPAPHG